MTETAVAAPVETRDTKLEIIMGREALDKLADATVLVLGCGGVDAYAEILPTALESGVTPVMVKECVYQATDYLGYGRVLPFLNVTNSVLEQRDVALPLAGQATTDMNDRLEKGVAAQAAIFGEGMNEAWKKGHINRWLAANCFGDYYTLSLIHI